MALKDSDRAQIKKLIEELWGLLKPKLKLLSNAKNKNEVEGYLNEINMLIIEPFTSPSKEKDKFLIKIGIEVTKIIKKLPLAQTEKEEAVNQLVSILNPKMLEKGILNKLYKEVKPTILDRLRIFFTRLFTGTSKKGTTAEITAGIEQTKPKKQQIIIETPDTQYIGTPVQPKQPTRSFLSKLFKKTPKTYTPVGTPLAVGIEPKKGTEPEHKKPPKTYTPVGTPPAKDLDIEEILKMTDDELKEVLPEAVERLKASKKKEPTTEIDLDLNTPATSGIEPRTDIDFTKILQMSDSELKEVLPEAVERLKASKTNSANVKSKDLDNWLKNFKVILKIDISNNEIKTESQLNYIFEKTKSNFDQNKNLTENDKEKAKKTIDTIAPELKNWLMMLSLPELPITKHEPPKKPLPETPKHSGANK